MPRLNQSQIAKVTYSLNAGRKQHEGQVLSVISARLSKDLGFDISEAQLMNIAESIELGLDVPAKPPKTSKNDAILQSLKRNEQSLKRIEDKLDKVIG